MKNVLTLGIKGLATGRTNMHHALTTIETQLDPGPSLVMRDYERTA